MAIAKSSTTREICKHGHNGSPKHYSDTFTRSALTDELTLTLSSKLECDIFEDEDGQPYLSLFRPYLNQAEGLLYRINMYEYSPEFVIWEEDIPGPLRKALIDSGISAMKQIITETIRRLFESVDINYFHTNTIYRKVRWRIAKS